MRFFHHYTFSQISIGASYVVKELDGKHPFYPHTIDGKQCTIIVNKVISDEEIAVQLDDSVNVVEAKETRERKHYNPRTSTVKCENLFLRPIYSQRSQQDSTTAALVRKLSLYNSCFYEQ